MRLARAAYDLHVTPDGETFALPRNGPRVARVLRGQRSSLRADLAATFYDLTGRAASSSGLADALAVVDGLAARTVPTLPLHLRSAEHDGAVWLDLARTDGTAVRIAPGRWDLTDGTDPAAPVWRRTALTGELPAPVRGGNVDELWTVLNVGPSHRAVVVAWLVAALLTTVPVPILALGGEQGTGKSSATRALVSLIDPSPAPLRTGPKDLADWIVAAAGSRVVGLDNLSGMPPWLSDALCRAVTGEGLVRRALFTDDDLSVLFFRRVVLLNGIDLGISRGDLADRVILAELERIPDTGRRLDSDVADRWTAVHPRVLGGLLDLTADVLTVLPGIALDRYPRMADYARVLAAVDQLTGTDGLGSYLGQRDDLAADLIAGDPLAAAIRDHIASLPFGDWDWTGTAAQLLDQLHRPIGAKTWPTTGRGMSAALTRLAPSLRSVGVAVDLGHREPSTGRRLVTLAPAEPEGAGTNRHDRHDRHEQPLTWDNTRDANPASRDGRDGCPLPTGQPSPPTVTPSRTADQPKHNRRDGRDDCDGCFPSPLVQPTATCITCREPMTYDDGTHTHPTCKDGAA